MFTVTQLARKCGISRTAVLYYERTGLLEPNCRGANGYRWYGSEELERLEAILAYRSFGVPVANLAPLLDHDDDALHKRILQNRFNALEDEIRVLRRQQEALVALLEQPSLTEQEMIDKKRWTEIMQAAGLDDRDMKNWHSQFEKMEPEAHQEFLESLGIGQDEIRDIRNWSRG
mgnify:FL=1